LSACFGRNSTLRGRIPGIVNTKNSRDILGIGVKAIGENNLNQVRYLLLPILNILVPQVGHTP